MGQSISTINRWVASIHRLAMTLLSQKVSSCTFQQMDGDQLTPQEATPLSLIPILTDFIAGLQPTDTPLTRKLSQDLQGSLVCWLSIDCGVVLLDNRELKFSIQY